MSENLKARKLSSLPSFAIIKGAKFCGKYSLLKQILKDFDFFDFDDLRQNEEEFLYFIKQAKSEILVINEAKNIDENLLKNYKQRYFLSSDASFSHSNYPEIKLDFLDFEEFMAFSKKNLSLGQHLSEYLLYGQNPKSVQNPNFIKDLQLQLKSYLNENELLALRVISNHIGYKSSVLKLLKIFQEHKKISKNDFFSLIKSLQNRYLIYFIEHINKNIKRPYFCDFALKSALNSQKDFTKTYENLIANELLMIYDEIRFSDDAGFIINNPNFAVYPEAFTSKALFLRKKTQIAKELKTLNIAHILILTLSENFDFLYDGIQFKAVELSTWLLSKELNDGFTLQ